MCFELMRLCRLGGGGRLSQIEVGPHRGINGAETRSRAGDLHGASHWL